MALSVLGAGFGRTGTLSLKLALERLGLGPCYHMAEVFAHPEHVPRWQDAAEGRPVDWDTLLGGYPAAVDWPVCHFWRELADRYPEAGVLLTVRDPDRWYESVRDTIYRVLCAELPADPPLLRAQQAMARRIVLDRTFAGRFEDRDHAIRVYEEHNRAVRRAVPAPRLLDYEVSQGWEPLCRFLGRPVPDEPFPRVNSKDEFRARFAVRES